MRLLGVVAAFVFAACLCSAQRIVPTGQGLVVIITGPPGSGKSVQAGRLGKKYKVPVISMAELVKNEMKHRDKVSGAAAAAMASGEMIGDEGAIGLIGARVGQSDAGRGFILDGYPNSEAQAKHLDAFVAAHNFQPPKVVVLEAGDKVVRSRLWKRKRADDTPENIERRLADYHREEAFLNSWYKPANTVRVDATKNADEVFAKVEQGLMELFGKKDLKGREQQTTP
jgi:adenylate kinase